MAGRRSPTSSFSLDDKLNRFLHDRRETSIRNFDATYYGRLKGIPEREVLDIKELFDTMDSSHKGCIEPRHMKNLIESLGYGALPQTIYHLMAELDSDQNGVLEFEEFLDLMTQRRSHNDTRKDIEQVFRIFDSKNKGFIDKTDLRMVLRDLQEPITETELEEMVKKADSSGNGQVTVDDFYNLMTQGVKM
mmetsp:Transcript_50663/g.58080  ORF Transcript_50663/g.58080 Transcript_50663/m.58080 type:complete len:191 (-) Transcript_50663:26-598(-)